MTRTRTSVLGATFILLAGALALTLVLLAGRSSGGNQLNIKMGANLSGPSSKEAKAGEGPVGGYEAYLSASRTYPAAAIPPAVVARAKATFNRIAKRDARLVKSHGRRFLDSGGKWKQYWAAEGRAPAGRHLLLGSDEQHGEPDHGPRGRPGLHRRRSCRVWAGASGGGVWRSNNLEAPDPDVEADEPGRVWTRTRSGRSFSIRATRTATRSTSARARATAAGPAARPASASTSRPMPASTGRSSTTRASATGPTPASTRARTRSSAAGSTRS